jgi:hypothetical protein
MRAASIGNTVAVAASLRFGVRPLRALWDVTHCDRTVLQEAYPGARLSGGAIPRGGGGIYGYHLRILCVRFDGE